MKPRNDPNARLFSHHIEDYPKVESYQCNLLQVLWCHLQHSEVNQHLRLNEDYFPLLSLIFHSVFPMQQRLSVLFSLPS